MVVLSVADYQRIVTWIRTFNGLWVECAKHIPSQFPDIDPIILSSIVAREGQTRLRQHHSRVNKDIRKILSEYNRRVNESKSAASKDDIILRMAADLKFSPISLCRQLLAEKYKTTHKKEATKLLKNPNLIPDLTLAVNVLKCQMNDNLDGPVTDHIRRFVGEEYEVLLKTKAKEIGLAFYDEGDLRRTGYDKTPDLKLAVPCMYRGVTIQWIESKASFGDMDSHKKYIRDQLSSYGNRFGAGIVIYWFGYLETIATCPENGNTILVTDQFPATGELELLQFS